MSRSIRHPLPPGKDWWGKRPLAGSSVSRRGMRWQKRRLHKIERREGKHAAA